MNADPASLPPAPPEAKPKVKQRWWIGWTLLTVAALTIASLLLASPKEDEFAWLTPRQYAHRTQPGPFTNLKNWIKNVTRPVWQKFRGPQPQLHIEGKFLTVLPSAWDSLGLGAPTTASPDGLRAWILTVDNATALRQRLKTNSAVTLISGPAMITASGVQSAIFVGNAASPGIPATGINVDLSPKTMGNEISLTVNILATVPTQPVNPTMPVTTNLAAMFQARIPNGGSLVLDAGEPKAVGEKRYWMILSPKAVDAKGNPMPAKRGN